MPLHSGTTNSAGRGDAVHAGWWTVEHHQAVDRLAGRTPAPAHLLVAAVPGLTRDERRFLVALFEDRLMGSVSQLIRERFGPYDSTTMPDVLDIIEPAGWATPPPAPAPPGAVSLTVERRRRRPIA